MRTIFIFSLMICLFFCAGNATAIGRIEFAGGLAVPTGELDEFYDTGASFGAAYVFDVFPHVGIGINAGYNHVPLNEQSVSDHIGEPNYQLIEGGGVTTMNLCAEVRLLSGALSGFSVWGVVGGGLYIVSIDDREEAVYGDSHKFLFPSEKHISGYLGAGVAVPVAPKLEVGLEFKAQVFPLEHELRRVVIDEARTLLSIRAVVRLAI